MALCKVCAGELPERRNTHSLAAKTSDTVRATLEEAFVDHGCARKDACLHCAEGSVA